MEGRRFDEMVRGVAEDGCDGSRRGVMRALAGGVLAAILAAFGRPETVGAKKGKKQRCTQTLRRCSGPRKCCSRNCCHKPAGGKFCAPSGARCCPPRNGGGACVNQASCCGPKPGLPRGSCCPRTRPNCCPGTFAACCPPGLPACFPPTAAHPLGICCPAGAMYCESFGCCAPFGQSALAMTGAVPTPQPPASEDFVGPSGE